jgi:hypothetical protein
VVDVFVEEDIVEFERESIMAISGGVLWVSSRALNGHSDQPLAESINLRLRYASEIRSGMK